MLRLLAITASFNDGASLPRVHSLEHINKTRSYPIYIKLKIQDQVEDYDLEDCDILYIHRPVNTKLLEMAKQAKCLNKKIWVDNDDDQLSVPMDHFAYFHYQSPDVRNAITETTKLADFVTYSNKEILNTYGDFNPKHEVIPCAYDENLFAKPNTDPRHKTIMWRGSATHEKSVYEFSDAIVAVANDNPEWKFVFLGMQPWHIIERIKNPWYIWKNFLAPQKMWAIMKNEKPFIHMVPLTNNQFTRSRSNMAYLDATIAGAKVLAPNWDHWICPGITNYTSKEDFTDSLQNMISSYQEKNAAVEAECEYISATQTFKVINKNHIKIIEGLMQ